MSGSQEAGPPPNPEEFSTLFDVYEIQRDGDKVLYVGDPTPHSDELERKLWKFFDSHGYKIRFQRGYSGDDVQFSRGEFVLIAEPQSSDSGGGIPRTNLLLFVMTTFSTLLAGAVFWYQVPLTEHPLRVFEAWPFVVAIMGVLGVHELGHYVMSRYHGVDASLPYFIPVPTIIGSLGAVIKIKGRIPNRKALFDIGVAGPLAGLIATFIVTAIGLHLDPLAVQEPAQAAGDEPVVLFNHPPLLELIARVVGASGQLENRVVHPVVFGGWVGMLVTLLNMLPVGQLDGGHIVRAMFGERHRTISTLVPGALFGLAVYVFVTSSWRSMTIWILWGIFAIGLAYAGPVTPIEDAKIDRKRFVLGIVTFVLAALCFTPIPIEIVDAAELAA
ncbi:site-2 protease family protein [Halovenus rubra]|uniref:Site-2 protease family protein n=2 Tax=Halovenus rubra TaxID=869890 RepID=A0ACC7E246_9EURY|nr:site-2 protease family protein [Halovenus rubra]